MSFDLSSIFYPSSLSKVADPKEGAALFAKHYSQSPSINVITDFVNYLLESPATKPEDVDSLLQAALLISRDGSLPSVHWTSDRPQATFDEVFQIDLRDKIHSNLSILETSERAEFLHGSFIAGRALSLGLLTSPETVGAVGEGLKLPGEVIHNSTGEIARIRALGSCLQLLGSASTLIDLVGDRFAVDKVVKALEGIDVNAEDTPLVKLTIGHLQSAPLKDLKSAEIVHSTRAAGWNGL